MNADGRDLDPLDEAGSGYLQGLLQRHVEETCSVVAQELLNDWGGARQRFTVVAPRDYKRVLTVIDRARADGRNADDAVMVEIMGLPLHEAAASPPLQGYAAAPESVSAASMESGRVLDGGFGG